MHIFFSFSVFIYQMVQFVVVVVFRGEVPPSQLDTDCNERRE